MGEWAIIHAPNPDATPEIRTVALSFVYRFILDCHKKKAARPGRPDDAEESKNNDRTAEPEYNR